MHPRQPIRLDHILDIIGDLVADVHTPILARLVTNEQQLEDLALLDPIDRARELGQALVGVVAALIDNIDVEVVRLLLEQRLREVPEFGGGDFQDGGAGFVDERRGWVPGLDLLAEDDADARFGVLGLDQGADLGVECLEHLGAEGADIVEIQFEGVFGFAAAGAGYDLPSELGWNGHHE